MQNKVLCFNKKNPANKHKDLIYRILIFINKTYWSIHLLNQFHIVF